MNETLAKKIVLDVAFTFGDVVFLKTCDERKAGMVTRLSVTRNETTYGVSWGASGADTWHFDYELTTEYLSSFEN
jgi:hypothetical protein